MPARSSGLLSGLTAVPTDHLFKLILCEIEQDLCCSPQPARHGDHTKRRLNKQGILRVLKVVECQLDDVAPRLLIPAYEPVRDRGIPARMAFTFNCADDRVSVPVRDIASTVNPHEVGNRG